MILHRRIPSFRPEPLVRVGAPIALASVAAGLVAAATIALLDGPTAGLSVHVRAVVELAAGGGLGAATYLGLTWLLRLPELSLIVRLMSDTLSRLRPA
jgi:hypothetical protein